LTLSTAIRRIVLFVAVAVIGGYAYRALEGPQGLSALQEKRREIRKLEEENANLQREIQYRKDRIKSLQDNPAQQELEVRKNLKLLRPGETSFILPERPKQDATKEGAPTSAESK
jgi:cell division protein FtsB